MSLASSRRGRRRFLHAGVATAGAAWLPATGAIGQTSAKYRRVNVNDPVRGPQVLASYKKAIKAMLALPPTDPRNWYRIALTHTLDCPHGNCSAPYRRTAFPRAQFCPLHHPPAKDGCRERRGANPH